MDIKECKTICTNSTAGTIKANERFLINFNSELFALSDDETLFAALVKQDELSEKNIFTCSRLSNLTKKASADLVWSDSWLNTGSNNVLIRETSFATAESQLFQFLLFNPNLNSDGCPYMFVKNLSIKAGEIKTATITPEVFPDIKTDVEPASSSSSQQASPLNVGIFVIALCILLAVASITCFKVIQIIKSKKTTYPPADKTEDYKQDTFTPTLDKKFSVKTNDDAEKYPVEPNSYLSKEEPEKKTEFVSKNSSFTTLNIPHDHNSSFAGTTRSKISWAILNPDVNSLSVQINNFNLDNLNTGSSVPSIIRKENSVSFIQQPTLLFGSLIRKQNDSNYRDSELISPIRKTYLSLGNSEMNQMICENDTDTDCSDNINYLTPKDTLARMQHDVRKSQSTPHHTSEMRFTLPPPPVIQSEQNQKNLSISSSNSTIYANASLDNSINEVKNDSLPPKVHLRRSDLISSSNKGIHSQIKKNYPTSVYDFNNLNKENLKNKSESKKEFNLDMRKSF
ncbi:hypothetical protein HK099_006553 [Clydaea vesicula]|uniref:Uncharacterized protein n=1 Tax=Clydaea vesicula TaxID=447962 RepID=A0AAD5U125_9FUNG|nr:hypothetical protein HK099_006553 [Clydaea vesicula]